MPVFPWVFDKFPIGHMSNIGGSQTGPVSLNDGEELFWLDGTLDGDEFVDQSGNERNFTITNKDFTGSYFPYKSAATISAPVGDATLIAADVNNFLYDAGGDPNAIPVVSFFQNIDYEDKLFSRHVAQVTDGNGVETTEPHVKDIVLYSAALTGDDLTTANTYYGVPTEVTENVKWVAKDGNDSTGDGSKSTPWLTLTKANASATANDVVYVKSGVYTEDGALGNFYQTAALTFNAIGLCEVRQTSTTSAMYVAGGGKHEFNRLIFNGESAAYCLRIYNNVVDITFNKCKLIGSSTIQVYFASTPTGVHDFNDCVFITTATSGIALSSDISVIGSIFNSTSDETIRCTAYADDGDFTFKYNKVIGASSDNQIRLDVTDQFDVDIRYNNFAISDGPGIELVNQKETLFEYNIFNITGTGDSALYLLKNDATTTIANVKANYNYINTVAQEHYGIHIGADGGGIHASNDKITNIEVFNNTLLGPIYNGVTQTGTTIHGILVGFQKNSMIKHNYVNGFNIGIIKKHGGVADTAGAIMYNVIVDTLQGVYSKGVESVLFYGNTIINTAWAGLRAMRLSENAGSDGAINCVFRNNIVYNTVTPLASARGLIVADSASITGLDSDYNILYSTDDQFAYDGTDNYASLTLWKAEGYDANSVDTDPDLNSSYAPNTGSPAIGAGETLAATYDDGLDASTDWGDDETIPSVVTKQQTGSWDIGAYIS